jgi:hypothetical protein
VGKLDMDDLASKIAAAIDMDDLASHLEE